MAETLEEIAEKLFPTTTENDALNYQHVVMKSNWLKGAQIGVKWQQERSYSEEDMLNASKYGYNFHKTTLFPNQKFEDSCINNTKQWLTIFKKK